MMPCLKNIILLKNISLKIQQTVMKLRLFSEESWKSLISYFMPSFSFVVICYGLHLINFIRFFWTEHLKTHTNSIDM